MELAERIDRLFEAGSVQRDAALFELLAEVRAGLNEGVIRVAEPLEDRWRVHLWVKRALLLHRLAGQLEEREAGRFELDTLPARGLGAGAQVRVPPGSYIHDGVHLGAGSVVMAPSVVHLGARIGAGAVVDAHCLIGSGTQVEEGARIGAATQIGGVLEPLGALPTVVGRGAIITGNCGIYDGVVIGEGAYLGPGVQLSSRIRLFDLVKRQLRTAPEGQPLTVPPYAVVVPAVRLGTKGIAAGAGFSFETAVITAYLDDPDFNGDPFAPVLE